MKQELQLYVQEALEKRLKEAGTTNPVYLLSYCYENTQALHEVLKENNISHKIQYGGLKQDLEDEGLAHTKENIEAIGARHYWVESHGYICEIVTEDPTQQLADAVVLDERPEEYIFVETIETY